MLTATEKARLTAVVRRLRSAGVVPAVEAVLRANAGETVRAIVTAAVDEVEALTGTGNPDVLPELEAHARAHVDEVLRLLAGGRPGDLDFVRAHAERRAEQKFPLDAVLKVYRCLQRILLAWVRDAALRVADSDAHVTRVVADVTEFTIDYTDEAGALMTSCYVARTRLLAEAEGDRRSELLNTLLEGYDESDGRAASLLRRAGYLQQRQSYCVAVACSVNPREMENAARAERLAEAVTKELATTPLRTITGIRDNLVYVVISGTRRVSGWTAPQSLLAERVLNALRRVGPAALIGLSNDVPSTSHIPRASMEARLALDYASVAERVMPFASIPFRSILVAEARKGLLPALPAWVAAFGKADTRAKGALAATLQAYADCDMNVLRTAKALSIHPNTIYARMQKISETTGMNPLAYHSLTEMLLVLACAEGSERGRSGV